MWKLPDLCSRFLLRHILPYDRLRQNQKILLCMQALYLRDDVSDILDGYYVRKISIGILLTVATALLAILNIAQNRILWIFVGITLTVMLLVRQDQNLYRRMKEREYQMIIDYPQIISELTLLHQAGVSIYQTLSRIVTQYEKKGERRYAYEELKILVRRLERNSPEAEAFSRFGQRCHLHCYMKLANLLTQNMQKGNKQFVYLLQTEVMAAYELRKNQAIKRAQEAESKLLLPMGIQLVIVMALIMIPAICQLSF